jgi:hypothetical protein
MAAIQTPITAATDDLERAVRDELVRTYPVRIRRQVSDAIDRACEEVEQVNLTGGRACPQRVRDLVAHLQSLAGEVPFSPRTSYQAHDELFRLSSALLGRPEKDLEDEAVAEAER